jgi:hypothetical protein
MTTAIIKPQWSPLTIGLMVLGFIVFWPIGLAVLGYILWGEKFGGSADKAQAYWHKGKSWCTSSSRQAGFGATRSSGNAAFDEYREEQLRRLEEERRRLDEEIDAFHAHMDNLRKAKDREEFDRFMGDRRGNRQGFGDDHRPSDQQQSNDSGSWGQNPTS